MAAQWHELARELGTQPAEYIKAETFACDYCPKRGKKGNIKPRHKAVVILPLSYGTESAKDKAGFNQARPKQACQGCYNRLMEAENG